MNPKKSILVRTTLAYALLKGLVFFVMVLATFLVFPLLDLYISNKIIPYLRFTALVPMLFGLYRIIYWRSFKYEVTVDQIKYRRGVFNLREDYLELFRVKDYEKDQPFVLRVLGIMHLTVHTSDASHPILVLKGIPVTNLPDVLRELVYRARTKNRVYEVD